jgi:hypothetical protein
LKPRVIVLWIFSEEQKVLLLPAKQEKAEKHGQNLCQSIEGWQKSKESTLGTIVRLIEEELGRELARQFSRQYYYRQDLPKFMAEEFPFRDTKMATRHHFLWVITDQQLSLITRTDISFVGKEDLPRIKKLGAPHSDDDKILYEDDYKVLTEKILNPQMVLATEW